MPPIAAGAPSKPITLPPSMLPPEARKPQHGGAAVMSAAPAQDHGNDAGGNDHGGNDHGGDDHGGNRGGNRGGTRPHPHHPHHPSHDGGQGHDHDANSSGQGLQSNQRDVIRHVTAKTAVGNPDTHRRDVGVGEDVTFSVENGGTWHASAAGPGTPTDGTGQTFQWRAPATAGDVTITLTRPGRPEETAVMNVVAPTNITFRKLHDMPQTPAGVGMRTNLTFEPLNVSFGNAYWKEVGGADGVARGVQGYFETLSHMPDHNLTHNPWQDWWRIGDANHSIDDLAFSRDNPPINGGYFRGAFGWVIPNIYSIEGEGDDAAHLIKRTVQDFSMDPNGNMTVTKEGASATQAVTGMTQGPLQRFATLAEAVAYLETLKGKQNQLQVTMTTIMNLSTQNDTASIGFLVQALHNLNLELKVHIRCANAYGWSDPDTVRLRISGNGGSYNEPDFHMHNSSEYERVREHIFNAPFNSMLNYAVGHPGALNVAADVESTTTHHMSFQIPFPYDRFAETPMVGSADRYLIQAHIHDPVAT